VKQTWSDISKARERLGYEPKVSIKEGLAQTVEWARRHPDQL
jgi:UDP-glucuronate 4-epimerase